MKRIRELLFDAEDKLLMKQKEVEQAVMKERDSIQKDLDQKRLVIALGHMDERNKLLDLAPGYSICQGCTKPFQPKLRSNLGGWERCHVSGCTSGERLCRDCLAVPCQRCFAPTCIFHKIEHENVCSGECKNCCGFNAHERRIEMNSGCCGQYNIYGMDHVINAMLKYAAIAG